MSRQGPRVHRLPKRTDYKLIPAPLDLSLPLVTEKSPLPAIIVTPSSPSSNRDFSIAFLADTPKPSIRERVSSSKVFSTPSLRLRSILFVFVVLFILVCHLVTHSLAARHPHLELTVQSGEVHAVEGYGKWFDLGSAFERKAPAESEEVDVNHDSEASDVPGARR